MSGEDVVDNAVEGWGSGLDNAVEGWGSGDAVEEVVVEEVVVEEGAAEEGAVEEGHVEEGDVEDVTVEEGDVEEGDAEEGEVEKRAVEDGAVEEGDAEEGAVEEGNAVEGDAEEGAVEEGAVEEGAVEDVNDAEVGTASRDAEVGTACTSVAFPSIGVSSSIGASSSNCAPLPTRSTSVGALRRNREPSAIAHSDSATARATAGPRCHAISTRPPKNGDFFFFESSRLGARRALSSLGPVWRASFHAWS